MCGELNRGLVMGMPKDWNKKPHKLFDYLIKTYGLKNDRNLAAALELRHPAISRIRNGHLALGATVILAVHDAFGLEIREIKALAQESDAES